MYAEVMFRSPAYRHPQLAFVVPGSVGFVVNEFDQPNLIGAEVEVLTLPFIVPGCHRSYSPVTGFWYPEPDRAVLVRRLATGAVRQVGYGSVRRDRPF